ncbi:MAG: hypothetical protein JWQ76_1096, partial [Ramlibacter sp.]|nr:hypothetical protein [Ramlibacter sp.]
RAFSGGSISRMARPATMPNEICERMYFVSPACSVNEAVFSVSAVALAT